MYYDVYCNEYVYSIVSCSDGIKNGDEVDIDCGGSKCMDCNGNI